MTVTFGEKVVERNTALDRIAVYKDGQFLGNMYRRHEEKNWSMGAQLMRSVFWSWPESLGLVALKNKVRELAEHAEVEAPQEMRTINGEPIK